MTDEMPLAASLVSLYRQRVALTHEMAVHPAPTAAMADVVLAKGEELDEACESFRRQFYPKQHRVFVGLGQVWSSSRTGRSSTLLFDGAAR